MREVVQLLGPPEREPHDEASVLSEPAPMELPRPTRQFGVAIGEREVSKRSQIRCSPFFYSLCSLN